MTEIGNIQAKDVALAAPRIGQTVAKANVSLGNWFIEKQARVAKRLGGKTLEIAKRSMGMPTPQEAKLQEMEVPERQQRVALSLVEASTPAEEARGVATLYWDVQAQQRREGEPVNPELALSRTTEIMKDGLGLPDLRVDRLLDAEPTQRIMHTTIAQPQQPTEFSKIGI